MDWVSLYLGGKQKKLCDRVTFALFYFVFEGNFQIEASGSLYLEGLWTLSKTHTRLFLQKVPKYICLLLSTQSCDVLVACQ